MRFSKLALLGFVISLPLLGCSDLMDDGGAAHAGVMAKMLQMPEVTIDDEFGTDVRVSFDLVHYGGPDAETFEVVSASLRLDDQHYADIELAIPEDHPQFTGLADGEELHVQLRGSIPDNHDDWGLCADPQSEDQDELRVALALVMRVTPAANGGEHELFEYEALAVELHCSHTG